MLKAAPTARLQFYQLRNFIVSKIVFAFRSMYTISFTIMTVTLIILQKDISNSCFCCMNEILSPNLEKANEKYDSKLILRAS